MKEISKIIFSNSLKMAKIKSIIDEIAKTDITVLIKGETGSGKEIIAQSIHDFSHRRNKPFIKVNCVAIPNSLLESELFGFEKGAFTGAHLKKPGKFEMANGGTILLNDIEEMDLSIQAKLLQVLQDGVFSRLGGDGDISVDARVIVTTKNHLEKSMLEGRFREDLFYRINIISLNIPPLRERVEQIVPLSEYFFNLYRKKYKKEMPSLSSRLLDVFRVYSWPGNIRELENIVKRVVIFGDEESIIQSLHDKIKNNTEINSIELAESNDSINLKGLFDLKEVSRRAAEKAEKDIIEKTLHETRWNRKEAAKLLCISYKALLYKIEKYGLVKSRTEEEDIVSNNIERVNFEAEN